MRRWNMKANLASTLIYLNRIYYRWTGLLLITETNDVANWLKTCATSFYVRIHAIWSVKIIFGAEEIFSLFFK